MLLDDAKSSPNEIKASHNKNEMAYRDGQVNNLPRLDDYLVESAEVKLSSRISQVSEIYVSSLPIRPDSQWLSQVFYHTHTGTHTDAHATIAMENIFLYINLKR